MATEAKLEVSQMEENTAKILETEREPSNAVNEKKETETESMKDEEKKTESKEADEHKAKVEEEENKENKANNATSPTEIERSCSFNKESSHYSDLKENEKKALSELRSKLEEAILEKKLFQKKIEKEKLEEEKDQGDKSIEKDKKEEDSEDKEKAEQEAGSKEEENKDLTTEPGEMEEKANAKAEEESKENIKQEREIESEPEYKVDKDIALWGVPLLPSKEDNRTDTVLLKFLRAREFKVSDAFEMIRNNLKWRKENKIDSILDEDIEADLGSMALMEGHDRNGHPVCYNFFSVLGSEAIYGKTFEEKRERFMRARIQIMEKGIRKLDFKPGGVSTILQISDLRNTPLPTKKELRTATKKAVELLQDNYPEFVAKNIFINVPFWYYAYSALFSPSLSQRTKNKIVYARPAKVSDTLLKYIPASQIPLQYGGLKRENDSEFKVEEDAKEAYVKAGSEEIIEIPAPEAGKTIVWDIAVSGWEVNYKEEFVPADEGSYTIIISKGRRISWQESTVRNSFTTKEAGKIVITIENGAFKKKRILYRYKANPS